MKRVRYCVGVGVQKAKQNTESMEIIFILMENPRFYDIIKSQTTPS